jgi:hypothetical protein
MSRFNYRCSDWTGDSWEDVLDRWPNMAVEQYSWTNYFVELDKKDTYDDYFAKQISNELEFDDVRRMSQSLREKFDKETKIDVSFLINSRNEKVKFIQRGKLFYVLINCRTEQVAEFLKPAPYGTLYFLFS